MTGVRKNRIWLGILEWRYNILDRTGRVKQLCVARRYGSEQEREVSRIETNYTERRVNLYDCVDGR
jgi:hypothetical protein